MPLVLLITPSADEVVCDGSHVKAQMEKSCFILTYLTSQGRVPLLGLNDVIAGVLRGWPSCRVGWLLLQTFYQCRLAASSITGQARIQLANVSCCIHLILVKGKYIPK